MVCFFAKRRIFLPSPMLARNARGSKPRFSLILTRRIANNFTAESTVTVSIFAQFPPGKRAHHTSGCDCTPRRTENDVAHLLGRFWKDDQGQDIAEYAVMLAVILVIVVGTVR